MGEGIKRRLRGMRDEVCQLFEVVAQAIILLLCKKGPEKIIESHITNLEVLTPNGFEKVLYFHLINPQAVWSIELENGMEVSGADHHNVLSNGCEVHLRDALGMDIDTIDGSSKCIKVEDTGRMQPMFDLTVSGDHTYYTNGILSHNTITSALYILHYICFNTDKNAIVIGNRGKTATEVLGKIKDIFESLPHWVKPGVRVWNVTEVAFDNGCRIITDTTTEKPALGFTLHLCLWDEAAHVKENIATEFYSNLFPTLQAANGKMMITSTQNGYNLFYRLYKAAEAGTSSYKAFKVDWDRVPEWDPDKQCWYKRDEEWKQRQIANLGSEESFNSQFGTSFDIASNTLISQKKLKKCQQDVYEFVVKDFPGVANSDCWFWHPDVDPCDLKMPIAITCDLSEGVGGDYTVFLVWDISRCECIGFFRSNALERDKQVESLVDFVTKWAGLEKTVVSLERNTYGDVFIKSLEQYIERTGVEFDMNVLAKYYNESGTRWAYGIKITASNKPQYALLFKDALERGKIINKSTVFVNELLNFVDNGNGRFSASYGNDDMVMASIQLMFLQDTTRWRILQDYESSESDQGNMWDF